KKLSTTDPDATMTTSRKDYHLEPSYKQHTSITHWALMLLKPFSAELYDNLLLNHRLCQWGSCS
ncbi:hypothetical protein ACFL1X_06110, partial [Candidatus Hydrogenedentota bacterium]